MEAAVLKTVRVSSPRGFESLLLRIKRHINTTAAVPLFYLGATLILKMHNQYLDSALRSGIISV